jgi:hypothetical protein
MTTHVFSDSEWSPLQGLPSACVSMFIYTAQLYVLALPLLEDFQSYIRSVLFQHSRCCDSDSVDLHPSNACLSGLGIPERQPHYGLGDGNGHNENVCLGPSLACQSFNKIFCQDFHILCLTPFCRLLAMTFFHAAIH